MNQQVAKAFGVTEQQVELQAMALHDYAVFEGAAGAVVVEASAIATEFGAKFLATEAVKSFICTGTSMCGAEAVKLIPVVGNIVSGSVTFVLVRWLGMHVVEDARHAAERINELLLNPPGERRAGPDGKLDGKPDTHEAVAVAATEEAAQQKRLTTTVPRSLPWVAAGG